MNADELLGRVRLARDWATEAADMASENTALDRTAEELASMAVYEVVYRVVANVLDVIVNPVATSAEGQERAT
ncbi:hypothetical protein ACFZBU_38895 [Embleya sp. NPDC008237]|uniref:hypothetical protein n=1 Tax=Embleya sp. NPDC008237 TaxID=3363978 RepID=UPI0036E31E0E